MAHSRSNYILDADTLFRATGSAPITANGDTDSLAVALDKLTGARGDQRDKLGAIEYRAIINVEALTLDLVATVTFTDTMTAGDEFSFDDGTNAVVNLVGDTDFTVGVSATADAQALTVELNANGPAGLTAKDGAAGVVIIENNLATLGEILEIVDVGSDATVVDFAAGVFDESYQMRAEVGPVGFATSAFVGNIPTILVTGQYVMVLDAETIEKLDADHEVIRLVLTADNGGVDTSSFTYNAWLI